MAWSDVVTQANGILLEEFGKSVVWTSQSGTETVTLTAVLSNRGKLEEALPANYVSLWSITSNFSEVARGDVFTVDGASYSVIDIDPDDAEGEGITLTLALQT